MLPYFWMIESNWITHSLFWTSPPRDLNVTNLIVTKDFSVTTIVHALLSSSRTPCSVNSNCSFQMINQLIMLNLSSQVFCDLFICTNKIVRMSECCSISSGKAFRCKSFMIMRAVLCELAELIIRRSVTSTRIHCISIRYTVYGTMRPLWRLRYDNMTTPPLPNHSLYLCLHCHSIAHYWVQLAASW